MLSGSSGEFTARQKACPTDRRLKRVSKVAYREFGLGLTFAAVAEKPVLWCHGSLRHLHGWNATTPDVGVALHKSLGGIGGLEGLVTAGAARSAVMQWTSSNGPLKKKSIYVDMIRIIIPAL